MFYVVDINSLQNSVTLFEIEILSFKPTGNYRYINIYQNKQEAENFKNKAEFFVLNYEMFYSLEYSLERSGEKYAKNKKIFFDNIGDGNFEGVEEMFKDNFSRFVSNLGYPSLINKIISNFDKPEYYKIYSKCTEFKTESEQLLAIDTILSDKAKEEQERAFGVEITFFDSRSRF